MSNKFVIVGGGASHTPGIIASLGEKHRELKLSDLCFYDIDERRNSLMGEFARIYFRENAPAVTVTYTTDIEEAFRGASFLFVQIRPGCMNQRELDEKIPLKHGLVGQETCGLGGFAFALRTIPAMLHIVQKALEYCPEAWILNYSNPEAIISEAIYQVYPQAKALCICDMPISTELVVADYLKLPHRELTFHYFGLNHFGWFTHVYDKSGFDHLPGIRQEVLTNPSLEITDGDHLSKNFLNVSRMLRLFPEFLPLGYLQYYFFADEMVELSDPNYTRASYLMEHRDKTVFLECERAIQANTAKDSPLVSGVHGNYIVDLSSSIINDKRERFIINVRNKGCIANFNPDAVVEVPCYVGAFGAEPTAVGAIPQFHKSLMELQKGYELLTVEAALTGSYQKALEAIMLNKTVPSYQVGKAALDDLIEANKGYWGELKS